MLLYISSKAFPFRTFTVRVDQSETIARIRAQLLHILYEIGRENHQFRLRYKGQFLRDSYSIEDYGIVRNSIIKMVPLARKAQSYADVKSVNTALEEELGGGIEPEVKEALEEEIKYFNKRERLIYHFKGLQYVLFVTIWLCFLTTFWYSGFWTGLIWVISYIYCPLFTRYGGYIGGQNIYRHQFCIFYGTASLLQTTACVFFSMYEWTRIANHGCDDFKFVGDCSSGKIYSGIFFAILAVLSLTAGCVIWALYWNMKIEYGDLVEKYLVKSRDIEDIMKSAKSGRVKERRQAAFELATLAAAGDDNKFRIVAEGGLETLIRMALTRDEATQEYAAETIAELILVPAIQDNFVEMGGVKTLSALLHSKNPRIVYQACTALSYITSDSEENKFAVASPQGINDLCFAAEVANVSCQRLVAGIMLDMVFNSDIRHQMASMAAPTKALVKLSQSIDPDCQRLALQTLELMAIENASLICEQEDLLHFLLQLPSVSGDVKVYILAGKILLYFAEDVEACERIIADPLCKDALTQYAHSRDPIMQKVVAKVIYCLLDVPELRPQVKALALDDVLKYLVDKPADREVFDMAEEALQFMNDEHGIASLPRLTAAEKLKRMDQDALVNGVKDKFGSQVSLASNRSSGSSSSVKKVPLD